MPRYNVVVESSESTVVSDYKSLLPKETTYQSEADLEKEFIEKTKCWDFVFGLVCDQKGAVEVIPAYHLVTNVGVSGVHHQNTKKSIFNIDSTYTSETYNITKRPPVLIADKEYDYIVFKEIYIKSKPLLKRVVLNFSRVLRIDKVYRRII